MSGEKFMFPIADGTVKLSGREKVLRTSTLIPDHPDQGEEPGNLQGESESAPTLFQDSSSDDGEAKNVSGPCQEISFTVITLNRESNCTSSATKRETKMGHRETEA